MLKETNSTNLGCRLVADADEAIKLWGDNVPYRDSIGLSASKKWSELFSVDDGELLGLVNIPPMTRTNIEKKCSNAIPPNIFDEIMLGSWKAAKKTKSFREAQANGRDFLYYPLLLLIPDDSISYCEASVGISSDLSRSRGKPFFCAKIMLPPAWQQDGFSLQDIEKSYRTPTTLQRQSNSIQNVCKLASDANETTNSWHIDSYESASDILSSEKWISLSSIQPDDLFELVNLSPMAQASFEKRCSSKISPELFHRIVLESWKGAIRAHLFKEGVVDGKTFLYFPLIHLIPDDKTSYCEASIGISTDPSRSQGKPFYCAKIILPHDWQANGFMLMGIPDKDKGDSQYSTARTNHTDHGEPSKVQLDDSQSSIATIHRIVSKLIKNKSIAVGDRYNTQQMGALLSGEGYTCKGYSNRIWTNCTFLQYLPPEEGGGTQGSVVILPAAARKRLSLEQDKEDVQRILFASLEVGKAYQLSQIGGLLSGNGYDCKGVLLDFLEFCGYINLSETDGKTGLPLAHLIVPESKRKPLIYPDDKDEVQRILTTTLIAGESYWMSEIGNILTLHGFNCKGALSGFLQSCDFLVLSEKDPRYGQVSVRLAPGIGISPQDRHLSINPADYDSPSAYLDSEVVSDALRRKDVATWLNAFDAAHELFSTSLNSDTQLDKLIARYLINEKSGELEKLNSQLLQEKLGIPRNEARRLITRIKNNGLSRLTPDELSKSLSRILGEDSVGVECACRIGILTDIGRSTCLYLLIGCLARRVDIASLRKACADYSKYLCELDSGERGFISYSAWNLVAANYLVDALWLLRFVESAFVNQETVFDKSRRASIEVISALVDGQAAVPSYESISLCKRWLLQPSITQPVFYESLSRGDSAPYIAKELMAHLEPSEKRVFIHHLRNQLTPTEIELLVRRAQSMRGNRANLSSMSLSALVDPTSNIVFETHDGPSIPPSTNDGEQSTIIRLISSGEYRLASMLLESSPCNMAEEHGSECLKALDTLQELQTGNLSESLCQLLLQHRSQSESVVISSCITDAIIAEIALCAYENPKLFSAKLFDATAFDSFVYALEEECIAMDNRQVNAPTRRHYATEAYLACARYSTSRAYSAALYCSYLAVHTEGTSAERFYEALAKGSGQAPQGIENYFLGAFAEHGSNPKLFEGYCSRMSTALKQHLKLKKYVQQLDREASGFPKRLLPSAIYGYLANPENISDLDSLSASANIFNGKVAWCADLLMGLRPTWKNRGEYALANMTRRMRANAGRNIVENMFPSIAFLYSQELQDLVRMAPTRVNDFLIATTNLLETNADCFYSDSYNHNDSLSTILKSLDNIIFPKSASGSIARLKSCISRILLINASDLTSREVIDAIISSDDLQSILAQYFERARILDFQTGEDELSNQLCNRASELSSSLHDDAAKHLLAWIDSLSVEDSPYVKRASIELIRFGTGLQKIIDTKAVLEQLEKEDPRGWNVARNVIRSNLLAFPSKSSVSYLGKYVETRYNRQDILLCENDFRLLAQIHSLREEQSTSLLHKIASGTAAAAAIAVCLPAEKGRYYQVAAFYRAHSSSIVGSILTYSLVTQYWKPVVNSYIIYHSGNPGLYDKHDEKVAKLLVTREFKAAYQANPYELNRRIAKDYLTRDETDCRILHQLSEELSGTSHANMCRLIEILDTIRDRMIYPSEIFNLVDVGKQTRNVSSRFIVLFSKLVCSVESELRIKLISELFCYIYAPEMIASECLEFILANQTPDTERGHYSKLVFQAFSILDKQVFFDAAYADLINGVICSISATENTTPSISQDAIENIQLLTNAAPKALVPFAKVVSFAIINDERIRPVFRITGELASLAITNQQAVRVPSLNDTSADTDDKAAVSEDALSQLIAHLWHVASENNHMIKGLVQNDVKFSFERSLKLINGHLVPSDDAGRYSMNESLISEEAYVQVPTTHERQAILSTTALITIQSLLCNPRTEAKASRQSLPEQARDAVLLFTSLTRCISDNCIKQLVNHDLLSEVLSSLFESLLALVCMAFGAATHVQSGLPSLSRIIDTIRQTANQIASSTSSDFIAQSGEAGTVYAKLFDYYTPSALIDIINQADNGSLLHAVNEMKQVESILMEYAEKNDLSGTIVECQNQPLTNVIIEDDYGFDGNVYLLAKNYGHRSTQVSVTEVLIAKLGKDESPISTVAGVPCGATRGFVQPIRHDEPAALDAFVFQLPTTEHDYSNVSKVVVTARVSDGPFRSWSIHKTLNVIRCKRAMPANGYNYEYDARNLDDIRDWPILFGRDTEKQSLLTWRNNRLSPVLVYGSKGVGKTALAKGLEKQYQEEGTFPIFLTCDGQSLLTLLASLFDSMAELLEDIPGCEDLYNIFDLLYEYASDASEDENISDFFGKRREELDKGKTLNSLLGDALRSLQRLEYRFNVYIDEAQRLFPGQDAQTNETHGGSREEDRVNETNRVQIRALKDIVNRYFGRRKLRGLFLWTFIGCKDFIRLAQTNPKNEEFQAFFMNRLLVSRFGREWRCGAVRRMIGIDEQAGGMSLERDILGNLVFSESAIDAIVYYTAGHARSVKRIAAGIITHARNNQSAFSTEHKYVVYAGDIISFLRDSTDGPAEWTEADRIVGDDLSELTESETRILKQMSLYMYERECDSVTKDEAQSFLDDGNRDVLHLLEDRGIIVSSADSYRFASELYRRCCERMAIRDLPDSLSDSKISILYEENERLRREAANVQDCITDLRSQVRQLENEARDLELDLAEEKGRRKEAEDARKDLAGRPTIHQEYNNTGDVNQQEFRNKGDVSLQYTTVLQNISNVFSANAAQQFDFTKLFTPTASDEKALLSNAADTILALAPNQETDSQPIIEAKAVFLDETLSDGMKDALPRSLDEVYSWATTHSELLSEIGIENIEDDGLFTLAQLLSARRDDGSDWPHLEDIKASVMIACRGVMRSALVFWLFSAVEENADYAAAATPICRSFEQIWKGLMVDSIARNPIASLMVNIEQPKGQQTKKPCWVLSWDSGLKHMREHMTLGAIHAVFTKQGSEAGGITSEGIGLLAIKGKRRTDSRQRLQRAVGLYGVVDGDRNTAVINNIILLSKACGINQGREVESYFRGFYEVFKKRNDSQHGRTVLFSRDSYRELIGYLSSSHTLINASKTETQLLYRTIVFACRLNGYDIDYQDGLPKDIRLSQVARQNVFEYVYVVEEAPNMSLDSDTQNYLLNTPELAVEDIATIVGRIAWYANMQHGRQLSHDELRRLLSFS